MPKVIQTEIAVILIVVAVALGWALGKYLSQKVGLPA